MKDEEHSVEATFLPWVKAGYSVFLFDTGSTDQTIARFQQLAPQGWVRQEPFVDFAHSRTRLMQLVREAKTSATWMIMLDADFLVDPHDLPQLPSLVAQLTPDDEGAFLTLRNQHVRFLRPLLTRIDAEHLHYAMPVHEYLDGNRRPLPLLDFTLTYQPSAQSVEKSKSRWFRDLGMLHKALQQEPITLKPRILFYLARTYDQLQLEPEARLYYEQRYHTVEGYAQERYCACLALAELDVARRWDWLHRAVAIDGTRAEAFVAMAKACDRNPVMRELYAQEAIRKPMLLSALFLQLRDYHFQRYFEYAAAIAERTDVDDERKWEGLVASLRAKAYLDQQGDHQSPLAVQLQSLSSRYLQWGHRTFPDRQSEINALIQSFW